MEVKAHRGHNLSSLDLRRSQIKEERKQFRNKTRLYSMGHTPITGKVGQDAKGNDDGKQDK